MSADTKGTGKTKNLMVVLPAFLLCCWALVKHEPWRDEINPWGIACISQSFAELLRRVHYEAHPALWYVLLYGAAQLTHSLWLLKAVQGTIAGAIFLLLALTTPFRRWELALIVAGYYIAFQYTVMCRMYGLEVLFALVYVSCRMRHPDRMNRNAIWLALLANVDVTGMILGGVFLLEYLWERYKTASRGAKPFLAPIGIFLAGVALSAASLWPAKDIGWAATGKAGPLLTSGVHLGSAFGRWAGLAWVPQTLSPSSLWPDPEFWPHAFLIPPILVLFWLAFRKNRRMGFMILAVTVVGMAFSMVLNVGGIRHIGILFVVFLVAFWMMRFRGEPVTVWVYVLLGMLVISTGYAVRDQWGVPYVDDDDAVRWIMENHLEAMPMLGTPDTNIIGVPERLNRPVYQLECRCVDRVLTFARRRDGFDFHTDVPGRTVEGIRNLGTNEALLLENRLLTGQELAGLAAGQVNAELAAKFDRGYVDDEHFYLYRLSRQR